MARKRGDKPRGSESGTSAGARPKLRPPFVVDEEIDLHGQSIAEALVAVELALARHHGRPGAILRLIHGHSSGNVGSIRGALHRNLETVWRRQVKSFRPEPGNPGATLVLLP
jgi:DNA-nicking Smr family endonuclease